MSTRDAWPWLAVAGLGAFHGLHPATGWLFAAGFGLRNGRQSAIYFSLIPIAAGHALAIGTVALAVTLLGFVLDLRFVEGLAGGALIAWALARAMFKGRRRECAGSANGILALVAWSFLMSTSHGTGLMLVPLVLPLCLAGSPAGDLMSAGSVSVAILAVGLHLMALIATTAASATAVYGMMSGGVLQTRTAALQHVWTAALMITGLALFSSVLI
ncbi:MAG: hypothetical protein AB7L90_17240 [Hyphomicrobiaceae bacterium]